MSDDLISRQALIENLMQEIPLAENVHIFRDIIENQPTAFDKEKVIQSIESEYLKTRCKNSEVCKYPESIGCCYDNGIKIAIEIVGKGGCK